MFSNNVLKGKNVTGWIQHIELPYGNMFNGVKTRMHSSRMRTVRSSSRLSQRESASVQLGYQPPPPPGPSTPPGPGTPQEQPPPGADTPRGQTDTCKNITFATSLRTVIMKNCTPQTEVLCLFYAAFNTYSPRKKIVDVMSGCFFSIYFSQVDSAGLKCF